MGGKSGRSFRGFRRELSVTLRSRRSTGAKARGLYIDSFIPPDRLDGAYLYDNIGRVRAAAACAINARAGIVSLGGFSSILIEGRFDQLPA